MLRSRTVGLARIYSRQPLAWRETALHAFFFSYHSAERSSSENGGAQKLEKPFDYMHVQRRCWLSGKLAPFQFNFNRMFFVWKGCQHRKLKLVASNELCECRYVIPILRRHGTGS